MYDKIMFLFDFPVLFIMSIGCYIWSVSTYKNFSRNTQIPEHLSKTKHFFKSFGFSLAMLFCASLPYAVRLAIRSDKSGISVIDGFIMALHFSVSNPFTLTLKLMSFYPLLFVLSIGFCIWSVKKYKNFSGKMQIPAPASKTKYFFIIFGFCIVVLLCAILPYLPWPLNDGLSAKFSFIPLYNLIRIFPFLAIGFYIWSVRTYKIFSGNTQVPEPVSKIKHFFISFGFSVAVLFCAYLPGLILLVLAVIFSSS